MFEAFFDHLAQFGPDVDSRAAVGHKGYARKAIGKQPANVALFPISRIKANERDKATFFAKTIYKGRARIEQAVGKLKRFKRVALRCEKTRRNFESLVTIVAAFILVKSVHTA